MLYAEDIVYRLHLTDEETARFSAFLREQEEVKLKKTLRGIQIDENDVDLLIEAWRASEDQWSAYLASKGAAAAETQARIENMAVTTADVQVPYDVICPLFFQTSNRGVFSSSFNRLRKQYLDELKKKRDEGLFSPQFQDWGYFFGTGWGVGQNDFDDAFYICVEEIKKRAAVLGADAVVGLRMDIDLDTNAFEYFYIQMYGTAVRYK